MSQPRLHDLAKEFGFDTANFEVAAMLKGLLSSIASGPIDSGGSADNCDLWVPIGGVEYYVNIRKSNAQIARDAVTK